jgi:Flp pilus assembly protein TadB
MTEQEQQPQPAEPEDHPQAMDPDTVWKQANEAWLQAHWKIMLPVILVIAFVVFILPWVFFSFLTALGIQLFGALGFWVVFMRYTTAFDRKPKP